MGDDHEETLEIIFMYSQEAIHSKFYDLCKICSLYFVQKIITSFCGHLPRYQQQMASIASQIVVV